MFDCHKAVGMDALVDDRVNCSCDLLYSLWRDVRHLEGDSRQLVVRRSSFVNIGSERSIQQSGRI